MERIAFFTLGAVMMLGAIAVLVLSAWVKIPIM